uniref:VHS domain-containing protein n=1 Tax=Bionectria ochroleuca TaxID=29856 RepID=A0A8H7NLQ3_BIOOC
MILRILCDNPGPSFTRSFDQDFVDTVRKLLGSGKDSKVQRMLMEILDDFEFTRMDDGNLVLLIEMWKKEKAAAYTRFGAPRRQEHRRSHQHPPTSTPKTTLPEAIATGGCLTQSSWLAG